MINLKIMIKQAPNRSDVRLATKSKQNNYSQVESELNYVRN